LKAVGDSKLSKKFQITVPKRVRERLRLDSEDLVVFILKRNDIVIRRGKVTIR
jgi:AbrB family looped-hinge helix DNA binding protein